VQPRVLRREAVTAIPLGRLSPERLDATYPHTVPGPGLERRGKPCHSVCAYLVLLRVEIARFTLCGPGHSFEWPLAQLTPRRRPQRLVSVALILTSRWRGVTSYAALCSPDLPPVRPFEPCTSGGLADFTAGIMTAWRHAHGPAAPHGPHKVFTSPPDAGCAGSLPAFESPPPGPWSIRAPAGRKR